MMMEHEAKDGKSRKYMEDSERDKWLSGREDGKVLGLRMECVRDTQEKHVNMWL